jgi:SAM-dependent methyltransferase
VSTPAQFSGTVPATYDRILGPVLFEPYARDVVARLPAGDRLRVLEIACGTGIGTRRLQEALSGRATIVATDLNEPMIEHARAAVASSEIIWQQADAQSCIGFVEGFVWGHAWASWREARDMWFCLPPGFSAVQGVPLVAGYLQAHPDRLEEEAHLLVFLALTAAYPCKP